MWSAAPIVQDQDYLVLDDGRIATVHGWHHPPDHVVAELTFAPDPAGSFELSTGRYSKAYLSDGRAVPDLQRPRIRDLDEPRLFGYGQVKSIISTSRIVNVLRCGDWPLERAISHRSNHRRYIEATWQSVLRLLGPEIEAVSACLTGSLMLQLAMPARVPPNPSLDQRDPHDLDVVFTGSVNAINRLARRMMDVAKSEPDRRVYEHGKGWTIRLQTDRGMLCSFFRYAVTDEIPRQIAHARLVEAGFAAELEVTDIDHGLFTPSLLRTVSRAPDLVGGRPLVVLISHLRSRGDFSEGSRGWFRGDLLDAATGEHASGDLVLSVFDGDSSIPLDPPWEGYWRRGEAGPA